MLTAAARRLLKIPKTAVLPETLAELYDGWFAGRNYRTRLGKGWAFNRRGGWQDGPYDICLEQHTAQCWFGLDREFRVYVECDHWVPIASSFAALVKTDALLEGSRARNERMRGFGRFPSHD